MYLRKIIVALSAGLVLLFFISSIGCSQKQVNINQMEKDSVINDVASAESNTADSETLKDVPPEENALPIESPSMDESNCDVPDTIVFDSIDEFILFTKAVDLSDENVKAFIYDEASGKYDMNGVENRDDLERILAWLQETPFPVSSDFYLMQIAIFPEWEEVSFLYENHDGKRCSFHMNMDNTTTVDDCLQTRKDNNKPFEEVSIPLNHTIKHVFYLGKYTSPYLHANPAYYFLADYGRCFAEYQTSGIEDYDAAVDALCEFSYSDILSLSAQQ